MKSLFTIIVVSIAVLISVEAEIPSYIKICKQNDPVINDCIESSINQLRPKLIAGIPELAVPPIDPLYIDRASVDLGRDFAIRLEDLKLAGLKDAIVQGVKTDFKKDVFSFNVLLPEIRINGTYDVNAKLASIPLKGRGPLRIVATSVSGRGTLQAKKVQKGGKTMVYFPTLSTKLKVGDYTLKLEQLFAEEPTIGEVTNKLLNEEKEEVLKSLLPGLERAISEKALSIANQICQKFTWPELFPES